MVVMFREPGMTEAQQLVCEIRHCLDLIERCPEWQGRYAFLEIAAGCLGELKGLKPQRSKFRSGVPQAAKRARTT